jgi:uncharacterized protein YdeI (YjbR/CyaY-like superfamily)
MNSSVDGYYNNAKKWKEELKKLRTIVLDCQLVEELKWKHPCYTFNNSNIVIIHSFKEYCAIGFFKGVLLKDANGILIQQTENSQSSRQIRFTSIKEVEELQNTIQSYIYEAIEIEEAGLKVELKKSTDLIFPEELLNIFEANPLLKAAFFSLTPGRQRAYNLYFTAPKQSKTRVARVENYIQQILNGKGISDCTCGLSKKLPYCDGSHKFISQIK